MSLPTDRTALTVTITVRTAGAEVENVTLEGETLRIGRTEGELLLADPLVSPLHATIDMDGQGGVILRDRTSQTGTFLNGQLIIGEMALNDGDEIRIAGAHLEVEIRRN